MSALDQVRAAVTAAGRVVALTGAGMSAESGVPTFRDAQAGYWARLDPRELATPEAWERDRERVWAWYLWRAALVRGVQPHAGHRALAALAERRPVAVVTQNVDDLHERAGSAVAAHVHGSLFAFRCDTCDAPAAVPDLPAEPVERLPPPRCGCGEGWVRPGVVWFEEALPRVAWRAAEDAVQALGPGDVALVVGTSGVVYPAAGLPAMARATGALVVEVNPHPSEVTEVCHLALRAAAGEALPALL